ncbi:hypothetical protein [Xenorhabdus hominickii]
MLDLLTPFSIRFITTDDRGATPEKLSLKNI